MAESAGSASIEEGKRKSYTREFKLGVLHFYKSSGTNFYKTAKNFSLNTKNVLRWIKDEQKLRESKKSKTAKTFKGALYSEMEAKLYDDYKMLRRKVLKVKSRWFQSQV